MIVALMREVEAVALARRVRLDLDAVDNALRFMDEAGPHLKPSMQLDVEAGRRTEVDSLLGVIGTEGRRLGVPTPVADLIFGALLPVDDWLNAPPGLARPEVPPCPYLPVRGRASCASDECDRKNVRHKRQNRGGGALEAVTGPAVAPLGGSPEP
jgi:hypothetical protein